MSHFGVAVKMLEDLKRIVGEQHVFADQETLYDYSHDETEDLSFLPEIVVKPNSPEQVSELCLFIKDW
jgi:glycolate oxidase